METIQNRIYSGIIVGIAVRGSIADSRIFRVRPGNGYFGAKAGKHYQDQYAFFVPSSINNIEGQPARDALKAGVLAWQALTTAQKKVYKHRASARGLRMAGYHLYMREYIKGHT